MLWQGQVIQVMPIVDQFSTRVKILRVGESLNNGQDQCSTLECNVSLTQIVQNFRMQY